MILRRLGNKSKIADKIISQFQKFNVFIDMFTGSGIMSFKLVDRCDYTFANDIDGDVFNLYMVLKNNNDELFNELEKMPIHEDLFKYWGGHQEKSPIMKAVRFVDMC